MFLNSAIIYSKNGEKQLKTYVDERTELEGVATVRSDHAVDHSDVVPTPGNMSQPTYE